MSVNLAKRFDMAALPIGAMSAVSLGGTLVAPLLIHHPVILMMLSPRILFMGLAAGKMSVIPFVLIAAVRLSIADPFHFILGRRHGVKTLGRLGRFGRWMAKPGRHHQGLAIAFLALRPIGRHLMWAGAQGVKARWVLAIDLVSTVIFCVIVHRAAGAL